MSFANNFHGARRVGAALGRNSSGRAGVVALRRGAGRRGCGLGATPLGDWKTGKHLEPGWDLLGAGLRGSKLRELESATGGSREGCDALGACAPINHISSNVVSFGSSARVVAPGNRASHPKTPGSTISTEGARSAIDRVVMRARELASHDGILEATIEVYGAGIKAQLTAEDRDAPGSAVLMARCALDKAVKCLTARLINTCSRGNYRPLELTQLPAPVSRVLLDSFIDHGFVNEWGQAVYRQQACSPVTFSLGQYLSSLRSPVPLVGDWEEVFGDGPMIFTPAPFPVATVEEVSKLLTAQRLELMLSQFSAGRLVVRAAARLGLAGSSESQVVAELERMAGQRCFAQLGCMMQGQHSSRFVGWMNQAARIEQHQHQQPHLHALLSWSSSVIQAAAMPVADSSSSGGGGGGGSGRGSCLTAVGADDADSAASDAAQLLSVLRLGRLQEQPNLWAVAARLQMVQGSSGSSSSSSKAFQQQQEKKQRGWDGLWASVGRVCSQMVLMGGL